MERRRSGDRRQVLDRRDGQDRRWTASVGGRRAAYVRRQWCYGVRVRNVKKAGRREADSQE